MISCAKRREERGAIAGDLTPNRLDEYIQHFETTFGAPPDGQMSVEVGTTLWDTSTLRPQAETLQNER